MAGYLDKAPTFNPYVAQQPIDAMLKVGMEKQRLYQQGYEKIQNSIDKVAGLELYKDVDKSYMQNKLNELGTKLKGVAAGDFSNFQLTNSVAGMAGQIANDINIQNAVASTAKLKKEMSFAEKERKEGKSSPENIYDLQKSVSEYVNSPNVGETFSGQYTPYIDLRKKWTEVYKALHPNSTEQDIAYGPNGQPTETMKRKMYEGVSEAQIANAIKASFNPSDMNQLRLSANYQFKDTPVDKLYDFAKENSIKDGLDYDEKIKSLTQLAALSKSDPETLNKALKSIEYYKEKKENLGKDLEEYNNLIATNPEEVKRQIYTNGAISQFAHANSWETQKINELTNPALQEVHWRNEQALRVANYNLAVSKEKFDETMALRKDSRETTEFQLKMEEAAVNARGSMSGATAYGGENTDYVDPKIALETEIVEGKEQYNSTVMRIAKQEGILPGQANYRMNEYKKGNLNAIPDNFKEEVDGAFKVKNKADLLSQAIEKIKIQTNNSPEFVEKQNELKREINSVPSISRNINGTVVTMSPEELFDMGLKLSKQTKYSATSSIFTPKEKQFLSLNNASNKDFLAKTLTSLAPLFDKYKKFSQEKESKLRENLLPVMGNYVPVVYNIDFPDKATSNARSRMEGIAMNAALTYDPVLAGMKGGAESFSTSDREAIQTWLADPKVKDNLQYKKLVQGGKTSLMIVNGTEKIVIPITKNIETYLPTNKEELLPIEREVKQIQMLNGGLATNPNHDPVQNFYATESFKNVKGLSVVGNLTAQSNNGAKQYLELGIQLPSGMYYAQYPEALTIKGIDDLITNQMDNSWVKKFFLINPNISQEVKEEIKKLK